MDSAYKQLLIDISAFMQTNAQRDMFKEKQYKELFQITERVKYNELINTADSSIKEIEKEVKQLRKESIDWISLVLKGPYDAATQITENFARILGFIYNKELYGKSFTANVQQSIRTWFNYGQRTPLEMQMMYDIPYISFPIRSLHNWTARILNPIYAKFVDDIIDGVYGQYADEDGQYSEFEQSMIQNGWLPITNNFGVRLGAGAFDIYNLINNPSEQIKQRYNPILRGLNEFVYESHDLTKAVKQLASTGILSRALKQSTLGAYNSKTNTIDKPKAGNASSALFTFNNYEDEYNKYIPYKYRNNRNKYYENIYRDWFTKYGRMRKPTVDPVQLVKNINWKRYLRSTQSKYRR